MPSEHVCLTMSDCVKSQNWVRPRHDDNVQRREADLTGAAVEDSEKDIFRFRAVKSCFNCGGSLA